MGVSIEKGATFLGLPLIKVRNVLEAWRHGNREDLWRIAEPKAVDLDPRTAMVLLEEWRDRGLLGPKSLSQNARCAVVCRGRAPGDRAFCEVL